MSAIESTRSVGQTLDWVFIVLLPNHNMGAGIGSLFTNYDYVQLCFNKYPVDGFNMDPGKESLDEICDLVKDFNRTFPCCKGTR